MTDMIIALLILSAVIGYWVMCRKVALKYQQMAVEAIEEYYEDESVPDRDKFALYQDYKMCRSWYFLPLVSLATPFALAASLVKKQDVRPEAVPRANPELYAKAFSAMNKMMIIRSPLISIASLSFTGICFAIAIPVGIAMNRASSISEPGNLMYFFNKVSVYAKRKAHIH